MATPAQWQWLLEAYRAMLPVKQIMKYLETEIGDNWTSWDFQQSLVDRVLRDSIVDKFPPHKSYVYRFIKTVTDTLEATNHEVCDDLMGELMVFVLQSKLAQDAISDEDMHHVSFTVPRPSPAETTVVTCRVATVFNEVGLKIWEAGWFLADYIVAFPEQFRGRVVLELGAGVGLTGLVLAKCRAHPARVVLSDYAPLVMQNLRYNIELNASDLDCPVDAVTLDWEKWEPEEDGDASMRPDILLAGDCVYDVAAFPALMTVLHAFLGNDAGEEGTRREAIFATTVRNKKTFQCFLDQLHQHRIEYDDITESARQRMHQSICIGATEQDIRLCKLYRAD
ncbi:TPA: hypothetical protein N0F65_006644 [Lagenidium giganteum]|uniref:FAM86 N-terminal domain-containing protein n=1 Tax=Lagenidium giganteum TaxID=4803 RepID=A0AAV2ZBI6_9STRA|nr:TPA: hypothetical protein N0F65_006644 [Lagenidium giganteum]